jgi:oxygen-independent coproporphyrinogen-3 oxidase
MVLDGKVKIQDEDYDAELYELTIDFLLSNGFNQYEVSNFTKPGYECRHNNAYWRYRDYLSFGPSAHSFVNGKRWWNFSSLKHYISEIENKGSAIANFGIDLMELEKKFGKSWISRNFNYIKKLDERNLVELKNNFLHLTKSGYAICDEILSKLI